MFKKKPIVKIRPIIHLITFVRGDLKRASFRNVFIVVGADAGDFQTDESPPCTERSPR